MQHGPQKNVAVDWCQ